MWRKFFIGFSALVCFISLAAAVSLSSNTMISPWMPFSIAIFVAIASSFPFWKFWQRLTGNSGCLPNSLCHIIVVAIMLPAVFYILNYTCIDTSSIHPEKCIVIKKFYKTRHRTKRVSRHSYTKGEPYNEYYMEVLFENGLSKDLHIDRKSYTRLKPETEICLPVAEGLFHIPVIRHYGSVITSDEKDS